ncbi:MAG: NAD(P)H-nitrite reductase [Candidatus Uhrbacteria bacterium GW2011_GWA2_52_8d]|uniref:NAD(P)H-nitrite reductase n=1 Tax=Candidatus Uhrbacteria bacterium GW2011_GWA2_52_8d TaxID=1618979 RepID=A0A0G1XNE0_9BACT|nr:MAG: NAD(P)H-nitrite reductase [Candidatus Uhrbacteria bacterium GW2011_GWA2_52_8d]
MKFLIIGGGVAGTTAAEELRKRDASAQITILSEEHHPLYSRVLLPHYMKGKVPRERVFLKRDAWYASQNIEWVTGVLAQHLDGRNKFVGGSDGREYPYDKLLIATGGEVRSLDEDLRGVSYLRTLDDADHFLQLVTEQGSRARGVVYGGGFIACEYINLFKHMSIPTTVVHRGPHFWTRSLLPEAGELIAKTLKMGGVELHENTSLQSLTGDSELQGIMTSGGEFSATILGVGIGIEPDLSWLRQAGMEVGTGVKANEFLETNIPDVFTAGDIAEFDDPITGRQLQIGNWMNAMSQGRTVAKSMTGEQTSFQLVSSYATNVLGLEIIFVGDVERTAAEKVHIIGSVADGGITQVFERAGRIVGGVLIGRNTDRASITKAIQEKQPFSSLNLL